MRAKRAASNYVRAEARVSATRLFHIDLLKDAKIRVGQEEGMLQWTFFCPPCKKGFTSKASPALHFRKKHHRRAEYRRYAIGSLCRACGVEYCTQRPVTEEPQDGIKCWKRKASEPSILCPPENKQEAARVEPCLTRKWSDNPSMERAFWDVLDWIIYYDGACFDEVSKEIVDRFSVYPFYKDEFRLILSRLADVARDLVFDEGVVLWQTLGPEAMISKLTHWALAFDSLVFSGQKESMLGYTKVDEQVLNDDGFWLSLLPAQRSRREAPVCECLPGKIYSRSSEDYQTMVIRNDVQGTQVEVACSCCNFVQALAEWQADTWNRYTCVLLHVQRYREEGLYLGMRHLQYPALDGSSPEQGLFHVLRCCWNYAVQGGPVAICADESFWASGISRPFQAMKRVSVSL